MWFSLVVLIFLGFFLGSFTLGVVRNLLVNILDAALLTLFIYLVLVFNEYGNRFLQTVTGAYGIYIIYYLLAVPLYILLGGGVLEKGDPVLILTYWCQILLYAYSMIVLGHVLKYALTTHYMISMIMALTYYALSFVLIELILPRQV